MSLFVIVQHIVRPSKKMQKRKKTVFNRKQKLRCYLPSEWIRTDTNDKQTSKPMQIQHKVYFVGIKTEKSHFFCKPPCRTFHRFFSRCVFQIYRKIQQITNLSSLLKVPSAFDLCTIHKRVTHKTFVTNSPLRNVFFENIKTH